MPAKRSDALSRREILRLGLMGAGASLLAACQPKPRVVEKEVEKTVVVKQTVVVTAAPAEATGPITVAVWGWWEPRMELFANAAKRFMETNPKVIVDVQSLPFEQLWAKVLPATAAGTGPAILKQKPTYYFPYLVNGVLEPYPEDLFPNNWWKENFTDTWEIYRYEGRTYVYVEGSMANLLMYNRSMFEAADLDPQIPPKTWDDLVDVGKTLTQYDNSGNILVEGLILGEFPWINAVYQLGGSLVKINPDGTRTSAMTSPEAERAFRWLVDLFTTHKISARQFLGFTEAIGTAKAAMGLMTSWIVGDFASSFPDTLAALGWAPPPTPSGRPEPVYGYKTNVIGLTVFKARPAEEKLAAFQYIEYLLKNSDKELADIAEIVGSLPGKISVRQDPRFQEKEALRVAVETLPLEKSSVQESEHLNEVRDNAIDRVVLEGMTVEESLRIADEEWNNWLKEGDAAFMQ